MTKEFYKLPVGHKYTGTFYIKKPIIFPPEYEQIVGTAFMREDLISWTILNDKRFYSIYHRAIFREPNENSKIERKEAEPVFAKEKTLENA